PTYQLGGRLWDLRRTMRQAVLDDVVLALNIAQFAQSLPKTIYESCGWRSNAQEADTPDLPRLLRQSSDWRYHHLADQQDDEIAPLHSITSSAIASTPGGMVRPSVLAVLRLITSLYFVGACTG